MLDSSPEQSVVPPVENSGRRSSAEAREASGEIGGRSAEKSAELQAAIANKERVRDSLRKTGQEKIAAVEKLENENDAELIMLGKMRINGTLSEETFNAEEASKQEKEEDAKRDMRRYIADADELDDEIEKMKAELKELGN